MEDPTLEETATLQPTEGPTTEEVDMPWKNCGPWRAHARAVLEGLQPTEGLGLEQSERRKEQQRGTAMG
ncbi:hypothetical protein llap_11123 [Limosa lapponica baueri]|uniref:Uncharacterized protein n=1 Tax=Limosa lapponica baueri TaxID=1758121 RepID=A0A2I0TXN6_LIMLA|nr:hypothetical protein llap_11123 [Limosa lapponica baueri]